MILCLSKGYCFNSSISIGIKQAAPIILITGMGGALGAVIEQMEIENYINNLTISSNLGIIFPFLIAAFLKTAQGSSTISIITTSSIVFPLLPLFHFFSLFCCLLLPNPY